MGRAVQDNCNEYIMYENPLTSIKELCKVIEIFGQMSGHKVNQINLSFVDLINEAEHSGRNAS